MSDQNNENHNFQEKCSSPFVFKYFSMNIFVESDLILKRSFPGSFAIFWVSEGDPKHFGNVGFS